MSVLHAEVTTVGVDEVVVHAFGEPDEELVTRIGDREVRTRGPHHVIRVDGLPPDTEVAVALEGVAPDEHLPERVRTLARPPGRLLATVATANDVHFGEVECGRIGGVTEDQLGPVLRSGPGEPPYPETMNAAVIDEIAALRPDAVVVKGDLTNLGTEEEYAAFCDAYGRLGDLLWHVRGNHDAMLDPHLARNDAPFAVDVGGVTLAVLDTVQPGTDRGRLDREQCAWLADLARARRGPVLAFGHHHVWKLDARRRPETYFGINPDDSEALAAVVAEHDNIVGYFAGHTHRNRVRRFAAARHVPFVEVGCTKDYPGVWAEYRIHEGGFTQVVRRVSSPDALDWTERTRHMFAGLYRDYALGPLSHRCFTETW